MRTGMGILLAAFVAAGTGCGTSKVRTCDVVTIPPAEFDIYVAALKTFLAQHWVYKAALVRISTQPSVGTLMRKRTTDELAPVPWEWLKHSLREASKQTVCFDTVGKALEMSLVNDRRDADHTVSIARLGLADDWAYVQLHMRLQYSGHIMGVLLWNSPNGWVAVKMDGLGHWDEHRPSLLSRMLRKLWPF